MNTSNTYVPKNRLIIGGGIFITGQLAPLLIPIVLSMDIGGGIKTALVGFLMLGIPELAIILSIVVMGKEGFAFLKSKVGRFFRQYGPPDRVSKFRYNVGLVIFSIPLLLGWLLPYFESFVPAYDQYHLWINLGGDAMLLIGLFVLGGDFWEKLRSLFIYDTKQQ